MKVKIKTEFCPIMLKTSGKLSSLKCRKGMKGRNPYGVRKSTVTELVAPFWVLEVLLFQIHI